MFRPMRRFKQQLSEEECIRILKEEWRGVLAMHGENGYPYAIPVDHFYDEESGNIYFHGAGEGHKIDAITSDPKVCYTVHDKGFLKDGDWALNISSVVVFGRIHIVEDRDKVIRLVRKLGQKYYPSDAEVEEEIAKAGHRVCLLELTIDHMTGKLVNEK